MRAARRLLFSAALALAALAAEAQFTRVFNLGGRNLPDFTGKVHLEPSDPVVGIPCYFVFEFTTKNKIEVQRVIGLPEDGVEYLSNEFEPYADGKYRLPVRFLVPCKKSLNVPVAGMQTVEQGSGTAFRSSFSMNFSKSLPPFSIDVKPLPEDGKPDDFSGAVGRSFSMKQTLSSDKVRPGDLITATYELDFDGYCPSNAVPTVEHLSKEFKAYEFKEIARTERSVRWTQVLVPRTAAATNTALVALTYYNPQLGRYEVARSQPKKLLFVSTEAASTENTSVAVTGDAGTSSENQEGAQGEAGRMLVLRFAPSDSSPVLATLPPDTPVKELARSHGWRRVETPRAVGWTR